MFTELLAIIRRNLSAEVSRFRGKQAKHKFTVLALGRSSASESAVTMIRGRLAQKILFWCALSVFLSAFVGTYIDDSYITLSYVKTLVETGVWGMHAQLPSNAATSPLNVLLLAALTTVSHDPEISVYVLTVGIAVIVFLSLRYFSLLIFGDELFAYGATALLFSNPLLISTLGLESFLTIGLILAGCVTFHKENFRLLGALIGLLILSRLDGLIVAFIFAVLLLRVRPSAFFPYAGIAFITVVCWHLYSWYYLGSLVPDTLFIKISQREWGGLNFRDGLAIYLSRFPLETSVSFAPYLLLVPLPYVVWRSKPVALLSVCLLTAVVLHFIVYDTFSVWPYHWYYSWIAMAGAVVGPLIFMFWDKNRLRWLSFVTAIAAAGVLLSLNAAIRSREAPINTNWASVEQYRDIAEWINDNHGEQQFDVIGELGVIQYYTNADGTNEFSNRLWLVQRVRALDHQHWAARMIALNFRRLRVPEIDASGYQLTIDCNEGGGILRKWKVHSRWKTRTTYCFREVAR